MGLHIKKSRQGYFSWLKEHKKAIFTNLLGLFIGLPITLGSTYYMFIDNMYGTEAYPVTAWQDALQEDSNLSAVIFIIAMGITWVGTIATFYQPITLWRKNT